jgi:hypothetical protein
MCESDLEKHRNSRGYKAALREVASGKEEAVSALAQHRRAVGIHWFRQEKEEATAAVEQEEEQQGWLRLE